MRRSRSIFRLICILTALQFSVTPTKATTMQHVFFVPPSGGNLEEFTGSNGGTWTENIIFGGGEVTPLNPTIAAFSSSSNMWLCYFNKSTSGVGGDYDVWVLSTPSTNGLLVKTEIGANPGYRPADITSGLTGYVDATGIPRVFFVAQPDSFGRAIMEAFYTSTGWHFDAGPSLGTTPLQGTPLVGYVYTPTGDPQVWYIGTDGHIHKTWQHASTWYTTDVTADAGAPVPAAGSSLMGYVWGSNAPVVYTATDEHIHQVYWNGSAWKTNDITSLCSCQLPELGTPLMGYFWSGNAIDDYIGTDQHVHQVWWTGSQMLSNDWTLGAGGQPFTGSPLVGNSSTGVFYLDTSGTLREYWWDGSHYHDSQIGGNFVGTPSGTGLAIATF